MWALDLEEMSPSVVKRIPLRMDRSDGYYPDGDIVVMPRDGYTALFENILAHPNIEVALNVAFAPVMLGDAEFCFTAMAIDEYFDFIFGELPYRSIRFHSETATPEPARGWSVTNFTGDDPFTRQTAWHEFPHHVVRDNGLRTHTLEEPCDYRDNNRERYYPIRTSDSRYQAIYERYRDLAARDKKVRFIGRCGTYQYLDMDQVINQSLAGAAAWLGMWSATNLALAL
jgi:UDP-galactopyranose mutase